LLEQYIAQAEADLANVEKSKEELNLLLHAYVMNIHEQMNLIDKKTTITLGDNRKKMLHIHTADALKNPDLYKVKVRDYVDLIIDRVWQNPGDLERICTEAITATALYDAVFSISTISIRLIKMEEERQTTITWNQAGKMSGAESFLCAFIVVSALLNYQRNLQEDNPNANASYSLLLMDNPFAKTQSEHIVSTLMKLCEATHIQMVAFTAVDNAAIVNAFSNIYTLKMHKAAKGVLLKADWTKKEKLLDTPQNLEWDEGWNKDTSSMEQLSLFSEPIK
jgi:hypothetical protein